MTSDAVAIRVVDRLRNGSRRVFEASFLRLARRLRQLADSYLAVVVARLLLGGSGFAAICWLTDAIVSKSPEPWFEPLVESSTIVGGGFTVLATRRQAALDERIRTLREISTECLENARILADRTFDVAMASLAAPKVFEKRLLISAVSTAFDSGSLGRFRDDHLSDMLHQWRDAAQSFNHRLDIAELRVAVAGRTTVGIAINKRLCEPGGVLDELWSQLRVLAFYLADIRSEAANDLLLLPADRRTYRTAGS